MVRMTEPVRPFSADKRSDLYGPAPARRAPHVSLQALGVIVAASFGLPQE
jgi:hypothetical protein